MPLLSLNRHSQIERGQPLREHLSPPRCGQTGVGPVDPGLRIAAERNCHQLIRIERLTLPGCFDAGRNAAEVTLGGEGVFRAAAGQCEGRTQQQPAQ